MYVAAYIMPDGWDMGHGKEASMRLDCFEIKRSRGVKRAKWATGGWRGRTRPSGEIGGLIGVR